MRVARALGYDIRLQWRHGFYYAYALICSVYILLLHLLPPEWKKPVAVALTFSDPSTLGFVFIGGLVLLEKGQGILDNLFVSPLRAEEYILSKTLALALLSLLSASVIHLAGFGVEGLRPLFVCGVVLTSFFFTVVGLGFAVRCRTLNGFFLMSSVGTIGFMVPLIEYTGLFQAGWLALLPTKASILLIGSTFYPLTAAQTVQALLTLLVWCILGFLWTRRSVRRHIIEKVGGGA